MKRKLQNILNKFNVAEAYRTNVINNVLLNAIIIFLLVVIVPLIPMLALNDIDFEATNIQKSTDGLSLYNAMSKTTKDIVNNTSEDLSLYSNTYSTIEFNEKNILDVLGYSDDSKEGSKGGTISLNQETYSNFFDNLGDNYCAEYINIVRKCVSGEGYMGGLPPIYDINGKQLYLDITSVIGINNAESSPIKGYIPRTLINYDYWGKDSGALTGDMMKLGTLNYKIYQEADSSSLYSNYWVRAKDAPTITTFQINKNYLKYPLEHFDGGNTHTVSTLNGYGFDMQDYRDGSDGSYFPDTICFIMDEVYAAASNLGNNNLTNAAFNALASMVHNGGQSVIQRMSGGGAYSNLEISDTVKSNTANYLNDDIAIVEYAINRDYDSFLSYFDVTNNIPADEYCRAYGIGVLIGSGKYSPDEDSLYSLTEFISNKYTRIKFFYLGLMGSWPQYRISRQDVIGYLSQNGICSINHAIYPQNTINKGTGNYGYLYKYRDDMINVDGYEVNALSSWNMLIIGHVTMNLVGGRLAYWKMLNTAGTDCTFEEAIAMAQYTDFDFSGHNYEETENEPDLRTEEEKLRDWFLGATTERISDIALNKHSARPKLAIINPQKLMSDIYDNMNDFEKELLYKWYLYCEPDKGYYNGMPYLHGACNYYYNGGVLHMSNITGVSDPTRNFSNDAQISKILKDREKTYWFDNAGLINSLISQAFEDGLDIAGGSSISLIPTLYGNAIDKSEAYELISSDSSLVELNSLKCIEQIKPFDIITDRLNKHSVMFIGWIDKANNIFLSLESTQEISTSGISYGSGFMVCSLDSISKGGIEVLNWKQDKIKLIEDKNLKYKDIIIPHGKIYNSYVLPIKEYKG